MVESSGALIVTNVRPGDEGVYSCSAENLLGRVNASAKLTVQCKLTCYFFYIVLLQVKKFVVILQSQQVLDQSGDRTEEQ